MFWIALLCCPAVETPNESDAQPDVAPFVVAVVDPDGKPLEGAEVVAYGVRVGSGVIFWREDGKAPQRQAVVTDADGRSVVIVSRSMLDRPRTALLTYATHPDFAGRRLEASLRMSGDDSPDATITLDAGTRLRIRPVTEEGELDLTTARVVAPKLEVPVNVAAEDDTLLTHPLPGRAPLVRVSAESVDGRRYDSDWVAWAPKIGGERELLVVMEPAEAVRGELSPDVPRPVRGGWVKAHYMRATAEQDYREIHSQQVPVAEDGTFTLDEAVSGCDVQLLIVCDGYTSERPSEEVIRRSIARYAGAFAVRPTMPACQLLAAEDRGGVWTVPMAASASVRVRVLTADGRPAAGVQPYHNANYHVFGVGNKILPSEPDPRPWQEVRQTMPRTDESGELVIAPLPATSLQISQLLWRSEQTQFKDLDFNGDPTVTVGPGETGEIELTLTEPLPQ